MARIYDNIETKFEDGLNGILTNTGVTRADFCVGYFNLRGWGRIANAIDNLPGDYVFEDDNRVYRYCRLLIGMNRPIADVIRDLYSHKQYRPDANEVLKAKQRIARDFKKQLLLGLPTKQDEFNLRHLVAQMQQKKVCVKLYLREALHAKLYLVHRPEDHSHPIDALMGSSNLTFPGLTKQGELDAAFDDTDNAQKLSSWFEDRWNDKFCIDITEELIDAILNSWASNKTIPPYYIYLKTAYELSQEARDGVKEIIIDPDFKKLLFPFQENAVKIAIKHLLNEKLKGAMIGDVVGLGKTITACAIAKYFEENIGAATTLIICPANLQSMWQGYIDKYNLKAKVMSNAEHIDAGQMRYYRLVIIDESHNLRNPQGKRYQNIKQFIDSQENSVLLLTATPYNKSLLDLSAQIRLFLNEDQDLGIKPEAYIRELGGDNEFKRQHSDVFMQSIKAFEYSNEVEDWNELMKLFLVRRTRTFVKDNYAKTDDSNGRKYLEFADGTRSYFPDRVPKAIKFETKPDDQFTRLYSDKMIYLMEDLDLPRYGLSKYVNETKAAEADKLDSHILDNLSRAGKRMMGFCRSTFFKRIDSSGFSFLLTLYRHILRNCVYIYAINNKLQLPIGDENQLPENFLDDEDMNDLSVGNGEENNPGLLNIPTDLDVYMAKAEKYYQLIISKNNVSWLDSKYFKRTLKQRLKSDCETLIKMINLCGQWDAKNDQKLNMLQDLLCKTCKDEKVLVFTQYSDTAEYICSQLKKRGIAHVDIATGATKDPTDVVKRFSPVSNDAPDMPKDEQTRVLIATDVLSEGQNLQDAHVIVNFDMPWAIIRLIQRVGRVDRIGQKAEKILCYSFFPNDGIEQIIRLRSRLNDRINEAAQVVGNDEVFFEGNQTDLRDLYNENASLDDEDSNDVDLASQAYEIWNQAVKANPSLKKIVPKINDLSYSTKAADGTTPDGVITYVKTKSGFDQLAWYNSQGELISQSQQRILKAMECSIDEPALEPLDNHHELVQKAVDNIQESNTSMSGMLGNRFSTRYRIVTLLEDYEKQGANLFFSNEDKTILKEVIDDIYNYPFHETVKTMLGRMLRVKDYSADDIVQYVIDLYKKNELVHKNEEEEMREHHVICSMGLRRNVK